MTRHRLRIRFRKEDDLRLISHRDLVRTFERLFRRVNLQLRMSEGFHPKAKMSFPSALALGICGHDEVMEVEVTEAVSPQALLDRLRPQLPPGLVFTSIVPLESEPKARVECEHYQFPCPPERHQQVQQAIAAFLALTSCPVPRANRKQPVDIRPGVRKLVLEGAVLNIQVETCREAGVRPRDVLEQLGLDDLENQGAVLVRTTVELAS